jgi:lysozyme family protein
MTASNYDRAFTLVLAHEGGYVDLKADPGGATNLGVTQATLSAWRHRKVTKDEVRALTKEEAGKIYRAQYWNAVRGDDLPAGLGYAVFDYAVNSGPSAAVKMLQRVLGVTADGAMGAMTLAAVAKRDTRDLIGKLCDRRLAFLRSLRTWRTFGKGWSRRVAGVRSNALAMAAGAEPVSHFMAAEETARGMPADVMATATAEGKASVAATIGGAGAAMSEAAQQLSPFTEASEIFKWVFVALMVGGVLFGLYAGLRRVREG